MYLVNGEACDTLSLDDRGLHYGDGLFETMAVVNGSIPLWRHHMARLCRDARRLGLAAPDRDVLQEEAARLCHGIERGVLKLILTRLGKRGYRASQQAGATRILGRYPWPDYPAAFNDHGITARVCELRLGRNPRLAGIKHLNRLEQVLARSEWEDEAIAEGLLLDELGHVIEGTQSNLFVVHDGRLLTPELNHCGVAGVMRALILEEAHRQDIPCAETTLRLGDVLEADEVFFCNSLVGVWPVRALAEIRYPVGEVTRRLAQHATSLLQSGGEASA